MHSLNNLDTTLAYERLRQFVGNNFAEQVVSRLKENFSAFKQLELLATSAVKNRDFESAVGLLQMTANHAWQHHSSFFSSSLMVFLRFGRR